MSFSLVDTLRESRKTMLAELDVILAGPKAANRGLTKGEETRFDAKRDEIKALDVDLEAAEETERRKQNVVGMNAYLGGQPGEQRNPGARWTAGTNETYRRGGGHSYFQDLAISRTQPTPDVNERLARHASQMDQALASGEVEKRAPQWSTAATAGTEYRVNPSRVDGQGGYFVPPLWLIDEYVDYARAGRATADLMHKIPLPPGTDSINLPRFATPTATGIQTADAAAVTSVDMTDDFITAPVRTIAGQQDVAMQLLDQSPAGYDEIVFKDLQADYNMRLDLQVLTGTGATGQLQGILGVTGINAITFTNASPTLPLLWPSLLQAASRVANGVFQPPDAIAMTASRWYWAGGQLDTTNRPLVTGDGPFNAFGAVNPRAAQNAVGSLGGLPAIADANIPANNGTGVNEDRIIIAKWGELYLYESTPRIRVLQEVLSGTLQVRFQLYNYVAALPQRRPKAISIVSGTGLVAPAGY
jgi:HK97 family phage major capsid protein